MSDDYHHIKQLEADRNVLAAEVMELRKQRTTTVTLRAMRACNATDESGALERAK